MYLSTKILPRSRGITELTIVYLSAGKQALTRFLHFLAPLRAPAQIRIYPGNPGYGLYLMFAHDIQYSKSITKESDDMPEHYYNHSRRNARALAGPYPSSPYPGISLPPAQAPLPLEAGMVPAAGAELVETSLAAPAAEAGAKAGGLLGGLGNLGNLANMEQIKGFIDRMGGIDGIVNNMGKVQKMVQGFQQMAPMVKLVMGSFGKGKGNSGELAAEEDAALYKPRRRKKRPAGNTKRSGKNAPKRRKRAPSSAGRRRR